jgi:hypothetical protein
MDAQIKKSKTIREFDHNDKKYILTEYTAKVVKDAKFAYSKRFTECVREKIFTRRGLEKQLTADDPSFFDDYRHRREELIKNIADTEDVLQNVEDPDELSLLSQMLLIYRADLFQQDKLVNDLFANTADQIAEEERIIYVMLGCIKNNDGTSVWESYEELMSDNDPEFLEVCKYQVMCSEYDLDPDWQEKLPEIEIQDKIDTLRKKQEKEQEAQEQTAKKASSSKSNTAKKGTAKRKSTAKKTSTTKKKSPASSKKRRTTTKKASKADTVEAPVST